MEVRQEEKRRFPRIGLKTPLRYQIRGTHEFNNSVTDDISLGGISFRNDKYIAPLTNLMLEIKVLSRVLNPIGKIVWMSPLPHSDRYHYGIEFLEFGPDEKNYLSQYIDMQKIKL